MRSALQQFCLMFDFLAILLFYIYSLNYWFLNHDDTINKSKKKINATIECNYQMHAGRDQSGLPKHRQLGCLQ